MHSANGTHSSSSVERARSPACRCVGGSLPSTLATYADGAYPTAPDATQSTLRDTRHAPLVRAGEDSPPILGARFRERSGASIGGGWTLSGRRMGGEIAYCGVRCWIAIAPLPARIRVVEGGQGFRLLMVRRQRHYAGCHDCDHSGSRGARLARHCGACGTIGATAS